MIEMKPGYQTSVTPVYERDMKDDPAIGRTLINGVIIMEKGHYGQYSGNARHSRVTDHNMAATKRDDEAHMEYLKEDVKYDNKHGHSDIDMTADEKHISKLAGDMKYDKDHHGPAKALIGDQDELPGHLQQEILDAPGKMMEGPAKHCFGPAKYAYDSPSKRYCIK